MTAIAEHRRTSWWVTRGPAPQVSELSADATADVAVIGGGFTGLTAAWRLGQRGANVILLEAAELGAGASGVNAGFVVPNFAKADPDRVIARLGAERARRLLTMIGEAADHVFGIVRDNGIDCDAEQSGWMHVAHNDAMLPALRDRANAWRALGRPVRTLDATEAQARTPLRYCAGALIDESGGTLHPLNYAYGLARLALSAGAMLVQNAPVTKVERDGERWRLRVNGRSIVARTVLLCTNAGEAGVARLLFRTIVPLRVYQIATRPLSQAEALRIAPLRNPIADTRANLFTYRLDRDNRLITGGMAIFPVGAHKRMTATLARRLQIELGFSEAPEVEYVWSGIAAMTTDFLPHIYEFGPGFIGGVGCNGRGIALTAMLGEALAKAAFGENLDDLPIPRASSRPIPFHSFAQLAPSIAIAQAKWQDRALAAS